MAMAPQERDRFVNDIRQDGGVFHKMLSKINTRKAQCSREDDRVRLLLLLLLLLLLMLLLL